MKKQRPFNNAENRSQSYSGKPSGGRSGSTAARTIWIYGRHAATAALENPRRTIIRVLVTQNTRPALKAYEGKVPMETTDPKRIEQLLGAEAVHQGIALEAHPLPDIALHELDFSHKNSCVVLLDQVTDPHNVGAILRSAAAFGAKAVIMPKDHSPPETTVLAKAASGALEIVPLVKVTNLVQAMADLKDEGFWCVGLDGEAKATLSDTQRFDKTALVMGAEGKGMRRLTAERCDLLAKLPIQGVESLNVSNAAAIALYELCVN